MRICAFRKSLQQHRFIPPRACHYVPYQGNTETGLQWMFFFNSTAQVSSSWKIRKTETGFCNDTHKFSEDFTMKIMKWSKRGWNVESKRTKSRMEESHDKSGNRGQERSALTPPTLKSRSRKKSKYMKWGRAKRRCNKVFLAARVTRLFFAPRQSVFLYDIAYAVTLLTSKA